MKNLYIQQKKEKVQADQTRSLLIAICIDKIKLRESVIQSKILSLEESLESESKSSAGDKFETGRAMLHIELDKQKSLTVDLIKMRRILNDITVTDQQETIALGALVKTNYQQFFLSVGLGKISIAFGQEEWFSISVASPIGRHLLDKKKGEAFTLNGKLYKILEIA